MAQWLGLCALPAEGLGSIPGQETKIPQAVPVRPKKKKQKKEKEKEIFAKSSVRKIFPCVFF